MSAGNILREPEVCVGMGLGNNVDRFSNAISRRRILQLGGTILGGSVGLGTVSGETTSQPHEIEVTVDPTARIIEGTARAWSESPVEFSFRRFKRSGIPDHVDLTVGGNSRRVSDWTYKVDDVDGVARFDWQLSFGNAPDCHSTSIFMMLDEEAMILGNQSFIPVPLEVDGPFRIDFTLPDDWKLYSSERVGPTRIEFDDPLLFRRLTIMAGEPNFDDVGSPAGPTVRHLILTSDDTRCRGRVGRDFKLLYDLDPGKNATKYQEEIGFYIRELSEIDSFSPPTETIVTPASGFVLSPDWGVWDTAPARRRHHNARHLGFMMDSMAKVDDFIAKSMNHYLADEIVHKYTGERRMLGNRYLKFLVFVRSIGLLTFDKSQWPTHNRQYAYEPVQAWYTDQIIKEHSDGQYSLKDLKAYGFDKSVTKESVPQAVEEIANIDISDEYDTYVLDTPEKLVEKFPLIDDQFGEYFPDLLNHQRLFSKAPDILFYTFIDLVTRSSKGLPSKLTIMLRSRPYIRAFRNPDFGGVTHDADVEYLAEFYQELMSYDSISKDEFLGLLNSYTDGRSSDFFEFYSNHARPPSMTDLNYFLNGEYQKLLSKQLYVDNSVEFILATVPKGRSLYEEAQSIQSLLQQSRTDMDDHNLTDAMATIDEAIERIADARLIDKEGTGIPDLKAYSQGIDPDRNVDPSKLTKIHLDGYALEWNNVESIVDSQNLQVTSQGESVYFAVKQSEPFFRETNPKFELYIKDQSENVLTQIKFQAQGEPIIPGVTDTYALENYSYIGAEVIEIEIPKAYLEFHGVSDPESAVYQVWDRETGIIAGWEQVETAPEQYVSSHSTTQEEEQPTTTHQKTSSTTESKTTSTTTDTGTEENTKSSQTTSAESPGLGVGPGITGVFGTAGVLKWMSESEEEE